MSFESRSAAARRRCISKMLISMQRSEAMVRNCATAEDLVKAIKDEKVQMIDLRFTDLPGIWQHFSVPPSAVSVDALEEGIGFDGSSIRGFQEIQESDMLVVADPTTAFVDPYSPAKTLVLICNIRDPVTGQSYSRDARYIAQKAETYLGGTGRADTSYFGPEAEFSSSTTCATARASTTPCTQSTPAKAAGTLVPRKGRISATNRARRRDTFLFRQPTACRRYATKWC